MKQTALLFLLVVAASVQALDRIIEPRVLELPDDVTFLHEPFAPEAYGQIPHWGEAAEAYGIDAWDMYIKRFLFADAILVREGHGTEGLVTHLQLHEAASEETAMEYGVMLTLGHLPDYLERTDTEVVFEGDFNRLILELDPNGRVTTLKLLEWSP